jgi:hypothetical protein
MVTQLEEQQRREVVLTEDVYRWPEFKAFLERAGVDYEQGTTNITIILKLGKAPRVVHEYLVRVLPPDKKQEDM